MATRPGDRADRGAEHGWRALVQPADGDPGDGGHRGRGVGGDERGRGQAVGADGAAGIEAEPAEPEEAGAEDRHRHVMRLGGRLDQAGAATDVQGRDQCGDAAREVDDRAAGEVEHAEAEEPAVGRPDPVGDRRVDEGRPGDGEQDERLEALALGEGAGDEGRGDDGEHHLEGHEGQVGDGGGVDVGRLAGHALEREPVEAADEAQPRIGAERQGVAPQDPGHADQAEDEEAVHDRAEHVLAANEAAIEEGQAGRHEHDQRAAGQHPGGISGVDRWHRGLLRRMKVVLCKKPMARCGARPVRFRLPNGCDACALCTYRRWRAADEAPRRRVRGVGLRPARAGGGVPSRMARAAMAADAGPVLMPHGPWPAHTKRPSTAATGPTKGRPSTDCGRAQSRRSISSAPSMAGRNSMARRSSSGAMRSRVGLARQERRAERAHAAGAGDAERAMAVRSRRRVAPARWPPRRG